MLAKFEHASLVLQGIFKNYPDLRKEFNYFIAAKLEKSGVSEELTFKEIFEPKNHSLKGVKQDFLFRFKTAFVQTFITGDFPKSSNYKHLLLKDEQAVASYFGFKEILTTPYSSSNQSTYEEQIPYEIYFPYSENWNPDQIVNYAISYHPLTNVEWNYGMFFDPLGNPLYEVTVDDDFAYGTPTYIITDDGLKIEDFNSGTPPIESSRYAIGLTDDEYNPIVINSDPITPNPSPCNKELRVKDGRWTLLRNGYGIFEGKIEYAVAVTVNVSEVTAPTQNPQSNPIIQSNRSAHAWGYQKIKRKKIKKMQDNTNEFISFGLNVSPWCAGMPDKMMFLYEYDRPNFISTNAKEWSELLVAGINLIGDSATRATVSTIMSGGVAPLVKNLLEGTANSRIEHYSIIGSNAVAATQNYRSIAMTPTMINGFRPYGKNDVCITLVLE